jgi:hypothetical protein
VQGTTVVTATASDATSGVQAVDFLLDGVVETTVTATPYTFSWDTTTASNGSHTLSANARDFAGNPGTSASVAVTVNNCVAETDAAFCAGLGDNCGSVSGTDNCGKPRTVASCGTCTAPDTCGGAGLPNVCGNTTVDGATGGTATASTSATCSSSQGVTKAYDDRMTSTNFSKWCVPAAPSTSKPISTMYQFAGSTSYAITEYTLTSADNSSSADPKNWTFQGCPGTCTAGSDTGWVTLDTRTGETFASRFLTKTYKLTNKVAYRKYRLRVTANNGSTSKFQLNEIQEFGDPGPCVAESDGAFCSSLGKNCGQVSGTDNCGAPRTVASCGVCVSPLTCGGGGTPNVCGSSTVPACATPYAVGNCLTYIQGTQVSSGGHNWLCSNGNCANCATFTQCAPGGSGCPWGIVWTDEGACQ